MAVASVAATGGAARPVSLWLVIFAVGDGMMLMVIVSLDFIGEFIGEFMGEVMFDFLVELIEEFEFIVVFIEFAAVERGLVF